jgi:eukaryotic-like serine/threonine-protein kinase
VDIYALGCVTYYLLTGDHVFRGRTTMEVCAHHLHTRPVPVGERAKSTLPDDLGAIVMDCLEKEPSKRPPSAEALLRRLQGCAAGGSGIPWTMDSARAWWSQHGAALRTHQASHTRSAGSTIAVDLKRR